MKESRLAYIDDIRILLTAQVIIHHTACTYCATGGWYYKEGGEDFVTFVLLTLFEGISQAFFMGFFFFLAGYFTPGAYDRKGPRAFVGARLKRLGIPLLVFFFVLSPLTSYVRDFTLSGGELSWRDVRFGVGPLWFVETLLIFSLFYAAWSAFSRSSHDGEKSVPKSTMIAGLALSVGIVTFLVRFPFPVGKGVPLMNIQPGHFPQYIVLFCLGVLAYRHNWVEKIPASMGHLWGVVGGVLIVLLPVLFFIVVRAGDVEAAIGGFHWQSLAYSVWEQVFGAAAIIVLLVWFREKYNRQGPVGAAMAASAYTAYIIHAPVLVSLTMLVRGLDFHPLLKFALVGPVAVALCFLLANVIRKLPLARAVL